LSVNPRWDRVPNDPLDDANDCCYSRGMSKPAQVVLDEALALSEDERLDVACELIASVDGPPDADWETAWLAELARRSKAAAARGEPAPEWADVRARILHRLGRQ